MPVHDLHKPLEDWAKKWSKISDEDVRNGDVRLEVETKKVRIRTTDPKFLTKPSHDTGSHSQSGVLFRSEYTNKTNATQEHTFIMERQTEATVTTSLSNGFTRNGNVGIQISVPDKVTNATGSFGSDVSVETEDENTVKHSVNWSITSKVNAPPGKKTVAVVRIKEETHDLTFQAKVTLKGRVLVRIMDGSGLVLRVMENDLATILAQDDKFKQTPGVDVDTGTRKVTWDVAGSLNFRFGVSQEVEVSHVEEEEMQVQQKQ